MQSGAAITAPLILYRYCLEENLCISYYEQPELIKDMPDIFPDVPCKVINRILEIVADDTLNIHTDLTGKAACLPDRTRSVSLSPTTAEKSWIPSNSAALCCFLRAVSKIFML